MGGMGMGGMGMGGMGTGIGMGGMGTGMGMGMMNAGSLSGFGMAGMPTAQANASPYQKDADSASELLDKLATAPLDELNSTELVDTCSRLVKGIARLSTYNTSDMTIIISAWTRVRFCSAP